MENCYLALLTIRSDFLLIAWTWTKPKAWDPSCYNFYNLPCTFKHSHRQNFFTYVFFVEVCLFWNLALNRLEILHIFKHLYPCLLNQKSLPNNLNCFSYLSCICMLYVIYDKGIPAVLTIVIISHAG